MFITEEIKNKTILDFSAPLSSEQQKHFQEFFALAVLRYFHPALYNDFSKEDAPDLQSSDRRQGVEVTVATSAEAASISGNYVKYRLANDEDKRNILKAKIQKNGGKIDFYGISYPVKSSSSEKQIIRDAIIKKNGKLRQYKDKGYEKMALFVYYEEPLCPMTEEQLRNLFEETREPQTYDIVYLCASSVLIVYQYSNKRLQIILIAREDFESLGVIARMTVDEALDMNSPIWTMCEG